MTHSPALPAPDVLAAFLDGQSERTRRAYAQDLADFARFLKARDEREACAYLLSRSAGEANRLALAWRAELRGRKLSAATINRRLAALRSLTKLARLTGTIPWSLETPGLPSESYRDTRGPGLSAVRAMLESASGDDRASRRDAALLHLLFDLGLRRSEVCALDLADLELARGALFVRGKGRDARAPLSLPPVTLEALSAWLDVRGEAPGPLFLSFDRAKKGDGRLSDSSLYRIVRARAAAVGARATPHGLRHTAITEACKAAAAAGIGLDEVRDFSRHKSIQVLLLYRDRERDMQGKLASLVSEAEER